MLLRIIDKETKLFLRDDFNFNPETEIGLNVTPSQGFIQPKWVEPIYADEDKTIVLVEGHWEEGSEND